MAYLIVTLIFGLIIAYFATQNTSPITLSFLNYTFTSVPIYVVVAGALLAGLFLSWIVSILNSISTGFTLRGKEKRIKDYRRENEALTKRVHELEIDNTRLKALDKTPKESVGGIHVPRWQAA